MTKTVKGIECKFALHIPSRSSNTPDIHMIKETIHHTDGTSIPNIRYIKDFKRPIWVTKASKRNHSQKKEWEHVDNLLEKQVTQSNLKFEIARLLGKNWAHESVKQLCVSPYVYGADISSTALIKKLYQDKNPDLQTGFSVATYDIETDVINGTEEPIMGSIVFKDKAFVSIIDTFVSGFSSVDQRIQSAAKKYIGEYLDKHKMTIEVYIAKDVVDMFRAVFNKAHQWKPDFLAIWNMDFDIPKTMAAIEKYGVDPKDILCDPSVPKEFRVCKYRQGAKKKITASGKVIPINPAMQWHTLICTSSFYVIDAMCAYKQIRSQKQEERSYSLDNILNKELGIRKLKFEEANEYQGLKWHQVMQSRFKIEYIIYNIFDCLSMLELDDKIKDLSYTLPAFSATSDFSVFKSQPKRIADALFHFCRDKGYILGTVPPSVTEEDEEEEDETLGLEGWIITLPAHLVTHGMNCIIEDEAIHTSIRTYVYDSDSVSAYPTCISVANVSKEATKRELIDVDGVNQDILRMQNLNLPIGATNAIEYATKMFNMPKPHELLQLIN